MADLFQPHIAEYFAAVGPVSPVPEAVRLVRSTFTQKGNSIRIIRATYGEPATFVDCTSFAYSCMLQAESLGQTFYELSPTVLPNLFDEPGEHQDSSAHFLIDCFALWERGDPEGKREIRAYDALWRYGPDISGPRLNLATDRLILFLVRRQHGLNLTSVMQATMADCDGKLELPANSDLLECLHIPEQLCTVEGARCFLHVKYETEDGEIHEETIRVNDGYLLKGIFLRPSAKSLVIDEFPRIRSWEEYPTSYDMDIRGYTPQLCFPAGLRIGLNAAPVRWHTSMLTNMARQPIYGYCLTYQEPFTVTAEMLAAHSGSVVAGAKKANKRESFLLKMMVIDMKTYLKDEFVDPILREDLSPRDDGTHTSPLVPTPRAGFGRVWAALKTNADLEKNCPTLASLKRMHECDPSNSNAKDPSNTQGRSWTVYISKCLCLISRWPLYSVHKRFLTVLFHDLLLQSPSLRSALSDDDLGTFGIGSVQESELAVPAALRRPIQAYIAQYINEVVVPPCGSVVEFQFRFGSSSVNMNTFDRIIKVTRPYADMFPEQKFPLCRLFSLLSISSVMLMFNALLTERKILFHSRDLSALHWTIESLISLMHPLSWHHALVPVLSLSVVDIIQAPFPFIVGMPTSFVERLATYELEDEIIVVDLNNDAVRIHREHPLLVFPPFLARRLEAALALTVGGRGADFSYRSERDFSSATDDTGFPAAEVRFLFFKFIAALVGPYRQFIPDRDDGLLSHGSDFLIDEYCLDFHMWDERSTEVERTYVESTASSDRLTLIKRYDDISTRRRGDHGSKRICEGWSEIRDLARKDREHRQKKISNLLKKTSIGVDSNINESFYRHIFSTQIMHQFLEEQCAEDPFFMSLDQCIELNLAFIMNPMNEVSQALTQTASVGMSAAERRAEMFLSLMVLSDDAATGSTELADDDESGGSPVARECPIFAENTLGDFKLEYLYPPPGAVLPSDGRSVRAVHTLRSVSPEGMVVDGISPLSGVAESSVSGADGEVSPMTMVGADMWEASDSDMPTDSDTEPRATETAAVPALVVDGVNNVHISNEVALPSSRQRLSGFAEEPALGMPAVREALPVSVSGGKVPCSPVIRSKHRVAGVDDTKERVYDGHVFQSRIEEHAHPVHPLILVSHMQKVLHAHFGEYCELRRGVLQPEDMNLQKCCVDSFVYTAKLYYHVLNEQSGRPDGSIFSALEGVQKYKIALVWNDRIHDKRLLSYLVSIVRGQDDIEEIKNMGRVYYPHLIHNDEFKTGFSGRARENLERAEWMQNAKLYVRDPESARRSCRLQAKKKKCMYRTKSGTSVEYENTGFSLVHAGFQRRLRQLKTERKRMQSKIVR